MRYAIISDIHANLEALTSVFEHIAKQNVDSIYCLGDIVGYGPNPNECIELIDKKCEIIITGNHDYACINSEETEYFNRFAKEAIIWTTNTLSEFSHSFISNTLFTKSINNCFLVHSSPENPSSWHYIVSVDEAIFNYSFFNEQVCFFGHSHVPIIFIETDEKNYNIVNESYYKLKKNERYLINVGSVGQPRDSNINAAYGIFDDEKMEYHLYRIPYDVRLTQQKMMKIGLPQFLINRLTHGR